jgi:hypothetical protein
MIMLTSRFVEHFRDGNLSRHCIQAFFGVFHGGLKYTFRICIFNRLLDIGSSNIATQVSYRSH